jgi:hypothetical protein
MSTDMGFLNEELLKAESDKKHAYKMFYVKDFDLFFLEHGSSMSKLTKELKIIFDAGRHGGIGFIYDSKTTQYIPKIVRINTDLIYAGNFINSDDLAAFKNVIPLEKLNTLSEHRFLEFDRKTLNSRITWVKL